MNIIKKIAALMLACCMILACFSCGHTGEKSSDAAGGTSQVTDSADVNSEKTVADIFSEKAKALSDKTERMAQISVKLDKKTGTAQYSEEYEHTVEYLGLGSESFIAQVKSRAVLGNSAVRSTETYSDGVCVFEIDGDEIYYTAEMNAQDYTARHLPAVIIDPSLYSSVVFDEQKAEYTFTGAATAESWAAAEYASVSSATGTVRLSDDGNISSMIYKAEYVQGAVAVTAEYEVVLGECTLTKDTLSAPTAGKASKIADIDIPMALRYATCMLDAGMGTVGGKGDYIYSQAAGIEMTSSITYASWGEGNDAMAKLTEQTNVKNTQGATVSNSRELFYKDGKTTYSEDGSEPVDNNYSFSDMVELIYEYNVYNIADTRDMINASLDSLPDYNVISYDLPDEYGLYIENVVNEALFGDEDYLDSYASSYSTAELTGYVCIDRDTGFFVGSGVEYTGNHTINNQVCSLIYYSNSKNETADPSAYTELTGESVPDSEPQKKPTPAFYEVTSADGKKMYLLGTIHVGDDRTGYLPSEITDALAASDALALEVNVDTLEQRVLEDPVLAQAYAEGIMYTDGSSNKSKLPDQLYKKLKLAAKVMGDTVYNELFYPSVIASNYEYYLIGASNVLFEDKGVDNRLADIANEKNIEIIEVEDIYSRVKIDSRYSALTQLYLLDSSLGTSRNEMLTQACELYEVWCEGDEEKIRECLKKDGIDKDADEEQRYAYEEYRRILMTERDGQMIAKAKEYLSQDKTVFFAVGLAHVLGDGGLVDSLREAGYTVSLVEYN